MMKSNLDVGKKEVVDYHPQILIRNPTAKRMCLRAPTWHHLLDDTASPKRDTKRPFLRGIYRAAQKIWSRRRSSTNFFSPFPSSVGPLIRSPPSKQIQNLVMKEMSASSTGIKSCTADTPSNVRNAKVWLKTSCCDFHTDTNHRKGLHLITESTPNGKKVQILLEELKEAYGLQFTTTLIDIDTDEQKRDWFLRLNLNGRIPVIVDNNKTPPHPVMESTAELLYLVDRYDKDRLFSFATPVEQSELIQWLLFWQASGQPYQSQTIHFSRGAGAGNSCKLARDKVSCAWMEYS